MADVLGLGLFRAGTGGAGSLFAGLILLPIVWIAAAPGFRYVLIVTGLTAVALVIPFLSEPPTSSSEWLRIVITPTVFSIVAAVVNELSRVGARAHRGGRGARRPTCRGARGQPARRGAAAGERAALPGPARDVPQRLVRHARRRRSWAPTGTDSSSSGTRARRHCSVRRTSTPSTRRGSIATSPPRRSTALDEGAPPARARRHPAPRSARGARRGRPRRTRRAQPRDAAHQRHHRAGEPHRHHPPRRGRRHPSATCSSPSTRPGRSRSPA